MHNKKRKIILTKRKRELYVKNAKFIKFLRRNPIIAVELLLGIKLMDSQKYILQNMWNAKYNCMCCSRNFGKSFLLDVVAMTKMLLYPNLRIYIVSSKGNQSIETFLKMEDMAKQRIESIPSLKDIFISEMQTGSNSDGFVHDKGSHKAFLLNNSGVFTLNSVPDNVRGNTVSIVF